VSALAPPRPGKILEGETGEAQANDGFLSKLVACKAQGKVMDFTVRCMARPRRDELVWLLRLPSN
jgi:hypothetical protein